MPVAYFLLYFTGATGFLPLRSLINPAEPEDLIDLLAMPKRP